MPITTLEKFSFNNSFKSYSFVFLNNLKPKLIHIHSYLFHAPAIFPPNSTLFIYHHDTFRCRQAQILQTRWFVFFSLFSPISHWLPEARSFPSHESQGGDQSRPSTWSWHCLHISLHLFSVVFLHTQQSTRTESQLLCFVWLWITSFFFFLTRDTRQLDYLISGDILMAH